jgi:anti-sigma factor RsiW
VLVDWSMTDQVTDDAPAELGRRQTVAGHQAWLASGPAASVDLLVGTPAGVTAGLADSPTCRKLGAGQVVEATINTSMFMSYQMLACIRGRTPTRPSGT